MNKKKINVTHTNILDIEAPEYLKKRIKSGIPFWDSVLGGGFVPSTTMLLSGEPGAGKTTLAAQVADGLSKRENLVLFNSIEQTEDQIADLADRLKLKTGFLFERYDSPYDVMLHCQLLQEQYPDKQIFAFVDSLSDMANGSRSAAEKILKSFIDFCQDTKIIGLFIVHLTKGGTFAGNQSMLHKADSYFHMEVMNADDDDGMRILHAKKHRFGKKSTSLLCLTDEGHKHPDEVNSSAKLDISEEF